MLGYPSTFLTSLYSYFFESDDEIDESFELIDAKETEPDTICLPIEIPSTLLVFSDTKKDLREHKDNYAKLGKAEYEAIERLKGKAWLKDLEIHDYLSYAAGQNPTKTISVLHPGYFSNGNFNDTLLNGISKPNGTRHRQREDLLKADLILCPVMCDSHWYLMAISQSTQTKKMNIRCLDGFNRFENHMELLLAGKQLVETLHGLGTFECDLRSAEVVRQNNGWDCGTVISFYGTLLCNCPDLFETNDNLEISSPYFKFRKVMIDGLNEAQNRTPTPRAY